MIMKNDLFGNDHIINVFTDASVKNHGKVTESLAGAILVMNENKESKTYKSFTRLVPSTNNEGELYAIYLGIKLCLQIKYLYPSINFTYNIFSDSKICVMGLRDWYKGWINNTIEARSDRLISSSGQEVKNQELFLQCVNTIVFNNIHINLYHLRGHINPNVKSQYDTFTKDFIDSNGLSDYPSRDLIYELSNYNNMIDNDTRSLLLPNGLGNPFIPTIMGFHCKDVMTEFKGVDIKREFLFSYDISSLLNNHKRYTQLMRLDTKLTNKRKDVV